MDTTIVEGRSISKLPYFDGTTNFIEWKKRLKIFIQSTDSDLWLVIENGPKIPKKIVDGEELVKTEDEFNDEDMKIMEQDEQAKNILCCALDPDDLRRISSCQTAKEMWEELDKSTLLYTPNLEFLDETSDHPNKRFLDLCVPIHKHALNGNWPAAKRILDKENKLRNAAITNRWLTLLHIAAGANRIHFVIELLKMLDNRDIELQDINGNNAFCIAAAAGNMKIVDLMRERNFELPVIRGGNGYTPVQYAALQGRAKMTWHLFGKTIRCFEDKDWNSLFFACINSRMYDTALGMLLRRPGLAIARDENEETALHLLSQHRISKVRMLTHNLISIKYRMEGVRNFKHGFDILVQTLWDNT